MRSDREAAANALVRVWTPDYQGSGVAVQTAAGVRIVTCEHVLGGKREDITVRSRVETADGEYVFHETGAKVVHVNKARDLALLELDKEPVLEVRPIRLASAEPELYEPLVIAACANGFFGIVIDGVLQSKSNSADDDEAKDSYIISGLSVHGSSGGAVVDAEGCLVGIITDVVRDEESLIHSLGYSVRLGVLRHFIAQRSPRPRPRLAVVKPTVEFTPDFDLGAVPACHQYEPHVFGGEHSGATRWEACGACDKQKEDPIHE